MLIKRLRRICFFALIIIGGQTQAGSLHDKEITDPSWVSARAQYKEALNALSLGKTTRFKRLKKQLQEYPLLPYLDYAYLRARMKWRTPSEGVKRFLTEQQDTPLAPQLKHQWLRTLAKRGQWQRYLEFYGSGVRSVELKCYALWAKYKTEDADAALQQVQPLWLVNRSQPRACDPIFKVWREQGHLTDELAWQRFSMAVQARKTQLARYLIRYMSKEQQSWAKLYREIHFYPDRLRSKKSRFTTLNAKNEEILLHGIKRLAGKDAALAKSLWEKFSEQHRFNGLLKQQIDHHIILRLARQDRESLYREALAAYPYPDDTALVAAGIDMALRQQDWQRVLDSIEALPEPTRKLARWQYWYARAAQHLDPNNSTVDSRTIYTALAESRDYYGFLAADHLNGEYRLNAASFAVDGNILEQFKRQPGVVRARELFLTGQVTDARREWSWASRGFSSDRHYTAAYYAHQLGWDSQAIRSTIEAERWNDLKLRFPLAFQDQIGAAANRSRLSSNWLLAIARQESAMTADAQSPKGAMGLMQIMPSTAKIVAKKHKISYRSKYQLLDPAKNIELASAYLKQLLEQYKGNSIYATAAYNAGPHRVNRWLQKTAGQPLDIWIENIPFGETRQYVKNVLAYSVIFAHLREQKGFRMATKEYLSEFSPQLAAKGDGAE